MGYYVPEVKSRKLLLRNARLELVGEVHYSQGLRSSHKGEALSGGFSVVGTMQWESSEGHFSAFPVIHWEWLLGALIKNF